LARTRAGDGGAADDRSVDGTAVVDEAAASGRSVVDAAVFPHAEARASRATMGTSRVITATRVGFDHGCRNAGHPIGWSAHTCDNFTFRAGHTIGTKLDY
jgi:hypothetical protein